MEKFSSQDYRDSLAEKLVNTRNNSESGRQTANEILMQEQETLAYKVSELLNQLRKLFPKESIDYAERFRPNYEAIENDPNWESIDISNQMTQTIRLMVEYSYLFVLGDELKNLGIIDRSVWENQMLKIREQIYHLLQDEKKKIASFINDLSQGAFFDRRNFTHVVSATGAYVDKKFDVASIIQEDEQDQEFYVEPGENVWATSYPSQPLMIMSPHSRGGRKFIEEVCSPRGKEGLIKSIKDYKLNMREKGLANYKNDEFIGYSSSLKLNGSSPIYRLLYLAGLPIYDPNINRGLYFHYTHEELETHSSWMDVFDTIIDLRAEKVFRRKISSEEENEFNKDIRYYRELLRNEFEISE